MVEVEENPARRMPSNEDLFRAGLLQACCQPICCTLLEMKLKLDALSLQIHRSSQLFAVCVGMLTHFRQKPIPPRADAEARARGPPLVTDQKNLLAFSLSRSSRQKKCRLQRSKGRAGVGWRASSCTTGPCLELAYRALRLRKLVSSTLHPHLPLETG